MGESFILYSKVGERLAHLILTYNQRQDSRMGAQKSKNVATFLLLQGEKAGMRAGKFISKPMAPIPIIAFHRKKRATQISNLNVRREKLSLDGGNDTLRL
jgi:hypothetical protein